MSRYELRQIYSHNYKLLHWLRKRELNSGHIIVCPRLPLEGNNPIVERALDNIQRKNCHVTTFLHLYIIMFPHTDEYNFFRLMLDMTEIKNIYKFTLVGDDIIFEEITNVQT